MFQSPKPSPDCAHGTVLAWWLVVGGVCKLLRCNYAPSSQTAALNIMRLNTELGSDVPKSAPQAVWVSITRRGHSTQGTTTTCTTECSRPTRNYTLFHMGRNYQIQTTLAGFRKNNEFPLQSTNSSDGILIADSEISPPPAVILHWKSNNEQKL